MSATSYEVLGAIITGGGGMETVCLCEEVEAGDSFKANGRWFRVKRAGVREVVNHNTFEPTHVLECEELVLVPISAAPGGGWTPGGLQERLDHIHSIICEKSNDGKDLELGSTAFKSVQRWSNWRDDKPQ